MLTVVVGGQFGSEGKGAAVGKIAQDMLESDVCVRVGGPNAGHTVYDSEGRKWALRQVPAAAPVSDCKLVIGAGSEIDLPVLLDEIDRLESAGHDVIGRLNVHPSATILSEKHKVSERQAGLVGRIGSTGKGIGAARADRIMRSASLVGDLDAEGLDLPFMVNESDDLVGRNLRGHVLVEGTQGYGLGLHTKFYPKCTSSDCRAIDFLSMAGISPWWFDGVRVIVVVRPCPIRVAGDSGPLRGETTWEDLGLAPEHTTVTKKVRRVGAWDPELVREAVVQNGGAPTVELAMTMVDHVLPQCSGITSASSLGRVSGLGELLTKVEQDAGAKVRFVGTGPQTMVLVNR
jgi:adenylosuccinate synthase